MEDNKIVKDPNIFYFHFDLQKDIDENLKHEIEFIMKNKNRNWTIKLRLNNYCQNISMETIIMNMENSKTYEPHKFALNLSQRVDLRSSINILLFKNYLFIESGKI